MSNGQPTRRISQVSRRTSMSSGSGQGMGQMPGYGASPAAAHRWRKLSRTMSLALSMGRRFSYLGRPSVAGMHSDHMRMPKMEVKLENTYQLKPDEDKKYSPHAVRTVMQNILDSTLDGVRYDPTSSAIVAQNLTDVIKTRIKEFNYHRYKIIVTVYIGSQKGQSLQMSSRAIWDTENDNFSTATYTNESLFCVALAHGVYFE
ncbi:dynein light chain Tctex-type protein 2B-like [Saccoglossus kowalevskii]|uniref:Tctex1 domain-containing protein 1-A-like n=1 Tax=Saccoglossus kowalevskii TaxID=10224 RepID=A0ABM0GKC0_SACKO|nr:PREDICTED: tctex1 domain-containing protein 1-A-like [Saccoglossus kowalevskii]